MNIKRIPQGFNRGDYYFAGRPLTSDLVDRVLSQEEIDFIRNDLKKFALKRKGVDSIQYYSVDNAFLVVCIDRFTIEELEEKRTEGASVEQINELCEVGMFLSTEIGEIHDFFS